MNFNIRKIEKNDYKEYLYLFSQLTSTDIVSFEKWEEIILEIKIIRGLRNVLHIEDLIVSNKYRGKGISKKLIAYCIDFSKKNNCYKIILNCNKDLISFDIKFGFKNKNLEMSLYL